jgi:peptidoglycan/xylan/chitin deacetylase (PgdA/CDA1 family)
MALRRRLKIGSAILALILIASVLAALRPAWVVAALARLSPEVIYFVDTRDPVVALTVDDGPDPVATAKILDVLRQHDARATFFLLASRMPGNEDVVLRTVEENLERQLLESHEVLSQFADVRWFRPGSGWYNAGMLSTLRKHDYRCALGSVYPFDPQVPSSWFAAHYILWNVRPGSIIVLHDYGARGERTAAALATILPELDRRGFRVVTLSELLDLD